MAKLFAIAPLVAALAILGVLLAYFYPEPIHPPVFQFDIPSPFSSAHAFFLSLSSLLVAYFFARGFIGTGSLSLLMLGAGSLILGIGFLTSQILGGQPFGGPNQLLGISSASFLAAGAFYAAFATFSLTGKAASVKRARGAVALVYALGIIVSLSIITVFETTLAPTFFQPGVGPAPLRGQVLGLALVLFTYTTFALLRDYASTGSSILYWFSLGLALVSIGFLSALLGKVPGGLYSWLARFSVAVGGIYLLLAIRKSYEDRKNT